MLAQHIAVYRRRRNAEILPQKRAKAGRIENRSGADDAGGGYARNTRDHLRYNINGI